MTDIDRIDTAADGNGPQDALVHKLAREHEHIDWHAVPGVSSAEVSAWVSKLLNETGGVQ